MVKLKGGSEELSFRCRTDQDSSRDASCSLSACHVGKRRGRSSSTRRDAANLTPSCSHLPTNHGSTKGIYIMYLR